jgi:hypothetical protein
VFNKNAVIKTKNRSNLFIKVPQLIVKTATSKTYDCFAA